MPLDSTEILEKKKELVEKRNALVAEHNPLAEEITVKGLELLGKREEIIKNYPDKTSEEYKKALGELAPVLDEQRKRKARVDELADLIELSSDVDTMEEFEEVQIRAGNEGALGGNAIKGILLDNRRETSKGLKERIGTDFWGFLKDANLIERGNIRKSGARERVLLNKDGESQHFNIAASWNAVFGENRTEVNHVVKSLGVDGEAGWNEDVWKEAVKGYRQKSMFTQTQTPQPAGGIPELYDPSAIFAGNTGGLCEYIIDEGIDTIPYPTAPFLECIKVRRIPESYVLFVRQTLRINNASAVAEGAVTPDDNNPADAIITKRILKPENHYGFSQAQAGTLTFATTIEVSEEFLEDCPAIADIVENQGLEDVRQEFYRQFLVGDGSTGDYPELTGLFSTLGVSTRVHRGASEFNGIAQGGGGASDDVRETFIRAMFDAQAFGAPVNCILMNHNDFVDMSFLKDDSLRPLYTEQELMNLKQAAIKYDIRVPEGVAMVGDFNTVQMLIRRALRMDIGWVDKQFRQDMLTLRFTMRGGILVRQPYRLVRITGL